MNKYNCSDGTRVSQATIDKRRSETYREMYEGVPHPNCFGCELPAQGSAHIVPQKICKDIGKAEYCWKPVNIIPACNKCNSIIESYKGDEIKKLLCYDYILSVTEMIDPIRFKAMTE